MRIKQDTEHSNICNVQFVVENYYKNILIILYSCLLTSGIYFFLYFFSAYLFYIWSLYKEIPFVVAVTLSTPEF